MGNKKKRGHPDVEEILARPWCYYCERDFDDLKILINHQKARHFKCERCGRRLNTAGGLSVHMTQVHKETLVTIENSLPNRSGLEVEIFGMEGIPEDIVTSHNQRILQQVAQAEADRRAATGNPGAGGGAGAGAAKKPKFESPSDLKKRLADHKAKKAAEQAAGISSGDVTPIGGHGNQSPGAGSPGYPLHQVQFGGPPNNSTYSSYPQPYGQQVPPFQQQPSPFAPPQQSPFPPPQPGFEPPGMHNSPFAPPQQFQGPPGGQGFSPPFQNGPPPFQNGPPPFQGGLPQFQNGQPQFQNGLPPFQNGPSQFQNGQTQFHTGPQSFGPGSPPGPFPHGQFQPPRTHTPPQNGPPQQRPGSLPPAPGLPQRPSFGAPPVNAFQMQQMHQGQLSGPPNPPENKLFVQNTSGLPPAHAEIPSTLSNDVDGLVSGAAKDADKAESIANGKPEAKAVEPQDEKKGKKDKDKNSKLIYSDNEISPEEKMAQLPRYAFVPGGEEGNMATGSVASITAST